MIVMPKSTAITYPQSQLRHQPWPLHRALSAQTLVTTKRSQLQRQYYDLSKTRLIGLINGQCFSPLNSHGMIVAPGLSVRSSPLIQNGNSDLREFYSAQQRLCRCGELAAQIKKTIT